MASDDLHARIAEAAKAVQLRLGPNALTVAQTGAPIRLSGGERDQVADAVLALVQPELERLRTACRSAAVLLRAVADRGANVDTLLDAAQDLDEISDPDRAQRPHMTAADTVGGFWPDMTGGRCSPCHLAVLRGYEPEPDCLDCNTTAKEPLS